MNKRTALVLGASGLVGQEVTQLLLDSDYYDSVMVFVRKPLQWEHEKLQQKQVDFSILEEYKEFLLLMMFLAVLGQQLRKRKRKRILKK